MPAVSAISFLDPTHVWTPDGSDANRSRRGPYKGPNGALYALQTAETDNLGGGPENKIYHGVFKSEDEGLTWALIDQVDTADVSGTPTSKSVIIRLEHRDVV